MQYKEQTSPRNEKGEKHGCWKKYWNEYYVIANFVNDEIYGYTEATSILNLDKRYYAK